MDQLDSGQWEPDTPERAKQLEFVLTAIQPARASQYLTRHLSKERIPRDGSGPWIGLIAKAGGTHEAGLLYQQIKNGELNTEATVRAMDALFDASRLRKIRPAGGPGGIGKLLGSSDHATKMAATRLAGTWRLGGQIGNLMKLASNANENDSVRLSAIDALRTIGGGGAAAEIKKLCGNQTSPAIRMRAITSLAAIDTQSAVQPFFETLAEVTDEQQGVALWRGILNAKDAGKILVANMPKSMPKAAALAGVRVAREGGRDERALVDALMPHTGLTTSSQQMTPEKMQEMVQLVSSKGDPHRGEAVYRRQELACITCHAIGGVGGKVGPDMTSLGASSPVDYVVQSLYDPNAKIKENYHSIIVADEDGNTYTGIQVSSNDQELVLRDAAGKLIRIPADEIVAQKNGKSLMPTGVVDRLSQQDQIDLISFLTRLGKPGDFDASKGGVARVYQVLAGTHRVEQNAGLEKITSGQLQQGWLPMEARVNGSVPRKTIESLTKQQFNISLVNVYARTEISIANAGTAEFVIEGPSRVEFWIDGRSIKGKNRFQADLKAGDHTVLVRMDARNLPQQFTLRSSDVTFAVE